MKHGMRFWKIGMALLLVAVLAGSAEAFTFTRLDPIKYVQISDIINDYKLRKIDLNRYIAIGNKEVYWNQRMVGDAIVEGATTVVQFDPAALEYVELQSLRDDVVDSDIMSPVFTSGDFAGRVSGTFQKAQLYILKPGSSVFPVTSDTRHPSWVVYSYDGFNYDGSNRLVITIFDAVTGIQLGNGISPPYNALSIGGPDWGDTVPCDAYYHDWMESAKNGFNAMGYDTEGIDNATATQIQGHIQSDSTALFYELDHGGSYSFHNICPDSMPGISGTNVGTWISGYTKMPFAFIGSCEGLCDNVPGTFSYEFRKNDTVGTAAVGYCHMDWTGDASHNETYDCTECWNNSIAWQDDLFDRLNNGETVQDAFDHALADYPMCGDGTTCMRLDGDPDLTLVPVVSRGSLPSANAGPDQTSEQASGAGTLVTLDGSASSSPNGATLTYAWSWAGGSATGVNPTATFPLGTTIVTLTVDDGYGSPLDETQRSDTVSITVVDTTPPVLTAPAAVTVEQTSAAGTPVTLVATATDICDAAPVITSNAPAVFPLGTTTVTFTATDASGNTATATTTVTVVDTTPPVLTVPSPVAVEQTSAAGTPVTLVATATDICDASPVITSDGPAVFPLGTTTVTFTATDASANSATATTTVTVVDTTPPDISSVTANPSILWSPNHKMVAVTVAISVTDICDTAPTCQIVSVSSNEPVNGLGDGDTAPDWNIKGDFSLDLRAERSGKGSGRVYTITVQCTDDSGNMAAKDVNVTVPHNK